MKITKFIITIRVNQKKIEGFNNYNKIKSMKFKIDIIY